MLKESDNPQRKLLRTVSKQLRFAESIIHPAGSRVCCAAQRDAVISITRCPDDPITRCPDHPIHRIGVAFVAMQTQLSPLCNQVSTNRSRRV